MSVRLAPAARRDSIVAAAVPLFARKGFAGTTTREIAEAAGVSEALVFKHFATKTALYDAILESCAAPDPRFGQLLSLPPSTDALIEIVVLVTDHFAGLRDEAHKARHRLFLRSLLEDGEFARAGLRTFAGAVLPGFAAAHAAARAAGDLDPGAPPAETAFWFMAQQQLMIGSLALADAAVAAPPIETVRAILRGIGLREAALGRIAQLRALGPAAVAAE
jgi:AcrR family transcriptional regulator